MVFRIFSSLISRGNLSLSYHAHQNTHKTPRDLEAAKP